ncbi:MULTISPECIES: hypothetical protein [Microbacterium]|uniref:DUF6891 domain-containing protein n=1 Tax=Microbacterium TaxID=33882 RepID=UPI0027816ACE|nr:MULTISPECIES: hypothetical protein [Microbacterium]MDQ1083905.1 hypothetical protein [Microbacterium sp. SORGH_AS_0344]MDQ1170815.1 hypothetical protein [Microbacterium proteolyticum]
MRFIDRILGRLTSPGKRDAAPADPTLAEPHQAEHGTTPADPTLAELHQAEHDATPVDPALAELYETAREAVIPGFRDFDEVVEQVQDVLELEDSEAVEAVVRKVWIARQEAEAGWPEVTEADRLFDAFEALGDLGVLALPDFTCCNSCGTSEIADARTPLEGGTGYHEWAYVFFHQQDTERLAEEPAHLLLTFSAFAPVRDLDPDLLARADGGDQAALTEAWRQTDARVGRIVVDALAEAGLPVEWSGDPAQRIVVTMPQWRQRLPEDAPAA